MGVKGLLSFVKSLPTPLEAIEEGSTLHIDGAGWCFQLIQQLNDTYLSGLPEFTLLGGLYHEFDQHIRQHVDYLVNELRLHLIVYDDGSNKRMKEATSEKRCEERNQKWINLLNICMSQKYEKTNLPFPRLCIDQFLATLADLSIPIMSCESEADQDIAFNVSNSNADSADPHSRHYAYANDSDFIAFADCPFIPFDSFTIHQNIILAPVYLRSTTSQLLELSESQFVDLCILMGNDYTIEVDRLEFLRSCGLSPSVSHDVHSLMSHIRKSQTLSSNVPKVQRIIDFSRELYELQDLSSYPYDESRFVDMGSLSQETKQHIEEWYMSVLGTSEFSKLNGLGHIALKYLSEYAHSYPQFSNEHYVSIREMLSCIDDFQLERKHKRSISEILSNIKWRDVEAATLYQNVSMKLRSLLSKAFSHFEDKYHIPYLNYDGYLYFSALHDRAVRGASSLATSLERLKISESPQPSNIFPRNPYRNSAGDQLLRRIRRSEGHEGVKPSEGGLKAAKADPLPIDEYRDEIIHRIRSDRVIIIHGETG